LRRRVFIIFRFRRTKSADRAGYRDPSSVSVYHAENFGGTFDFFGLHREESRRTRRKQYWRKKIPAGKSQPMTAGEKSAGDGEDRRKGAKVRKL
jgi:hypothetical protein